ncbi:hypothetical protein Tco_0773113 [Tanacetum coccineum]|uniref:Uncharacterized protein n=1 Tax=Tanacetum coccineum TaxID=301880 RepID=A0ABQ4ZNJ7_9ASTR
MVEGDDEIKEKDSQEEALIEFNSALENILEKLIQENDNLDDFYGFMYDTDDDDASISGKSSDHFDWDWPEKDSPYALYDQDVVDDSLDDEHVEEGRPSKRIRIPQEEMVKDEKPKKG